MRINMPVTDKEVMMTAGEILVTRTDRKGHITYANDEFVEISGFTREELIGANHNLVRHPDMPAAAFEDMWQTLKSGQPWSALVKNRTKTGDFYWVEANVVPVFKNKQIVEYFSVRYAPSREQIAEAEELYRKLNNHTATMRPTGIAAVIKSIREVSITYKVMLALTLLWLPIVYHAYQLVLNEQFILLMFTIIPSLLATGILVALTKDILSSIENCILSIYAMAGGKYRNRFNLNRKDQIGDLECGLYTLQVNFNSTLADRAAANNTLRLKLALDNVNSAVVVADADFKIIYINKSASKLFKSAEDDIKKQLPHFNAAQLMGSSIDLFHKNPSHQHNLLSKLQGSVKYEIILGGHSMSIFAHPVINADGKSVGYVTEWLDRSEEVRIENEVTEVVASAAAGNFDQRINEQNKTGFFLTLGKNINSLMSISKSGLSDIEYALDAMAEGDLTKKITNDYSGTFGQLKDDVNATTEKLKEVINQIVIASDTIYTAAREISAGNNNLSERTEEQAASLEQTAASMEQLTATVRNNTQSAKNANQLAQESSDIATKGVTVVGEVITTMDDICQSSHKISEIISVIDDIAFQTNILALNAAVEAARAGDKGKGFAVVAVEVRNLAQRSAKAAGEIKELIQDSVDKVQRGTRFVAEAGQTMEDIVNSIRNVTTIMSEISAASTEQKAGIEQVNQAIAQMDTVTQQNAALVEQAAAAAESLEEQAQMLAQIIGYFNLDNHAKNQVVIKRNIAVSQKTSPSFSARLEKPNSNIKTYLPAKQRKVVDNDSDNDWEEF